MCRSHVSQVHSRCHRCIAVANNNADLHFKRILATTVSVRFDWHPRDFSFSAGSHSATFERAKIWKIGDIKSYSQEPEFAFYCTHSNWTFRDGGRVRDRYMGAIDIGSNAMRMLIGEVEGDILKVVASARLPVRLGSAVFSGGLVPLGLLDELVDGLKLFEKELRDWQVEKLRIVATSALRQAVNRDEVIHKVWDVLGLKIDVISGLEEADLIGRAVRNALPNLEGASLVMDIGGGSVEFVCLSRGDILFVESLRIGTLRVLEHLKRNPSFLTVVERLLSQSSFRLKRYIQEEGIAVQSFIGTGGNLETMARLAREYYGEQKAKCVGASDVTSMLDDLGCLSTRERQKRYGLRTDRSDVIVPALFVVQKVMKLMNFSVMHVPEVGLREGVLWALQQERMPSDTRSLVHSCIFIGRHFNFEEPHALQVTQLALKIYDDLSALHGLGSYERDILHGAALLHDVGQAINPVGHHKHSRYIILNSDIVGLDASGRSLMATVARYHRKALPQPKHEEYAVLTDSERRAVDILVGILRCADALDRSHESRVDSLIATWSQKKVSLTVTSSNDLIAEIWAFEKKGGYLGHVLGGRLVTLEEKNLR